MINYTSQTKDNNFSINKHSLQAIFGIPGVVFYDSFINEDLILLSARLKGKTAKCPSCGKRSKSVHSSYMRKLTDLAAVGRAVKLYFKSESLDVVIVIALKQFSLSNICH